MPRLAHACMCKCVCVCVCCSPSLCGCGWDGSSGQPNPNDAITEPRRRLQTMSEAATGSRCNGTKLHTDTAPPTVRHRSSPPYNYTQTRHPRRPDNNPDRVVGKRRGGPIWVAMGTPRRPLLASPSIPLSVGPDMFAARHWALGTGRWTGPFQFHHSCSTGTQRTPLQPMPHFAGGQPGGVRGASLNNLTVVSLTHL